ncbi:PHP domain-containing protein [Halovivax gelatinilyticus]|uniref:PHP domain-containing protein n=1 Tax=Halovivax gelatinilyticus TaxID=2961597 RepID=UPI0020CA8751|nr:PHP domain-containing protein [Halovivax gelatinilyticus]
MTPPYADLHVHTTRSDGSLDPDAVADAARSAGVAVVAITDHDRCPPFDLSRIDDRGEPVTVVAGIELRVEPDDGERLDLLGYGVRRTDALLDATERIQANRRDRGRQIVERVETHLDVDLDVTVDAGFGRPHVARAIDAHPGTPLSYQDAFDELIGDDGPCYVPRDVPSFERGRDLLTRACDLVSLAHPLRYRDPRAALDLAVAGGLDAVEREYPYDRETDRTLVERAIEDGELRVTGGSDAHGDRVGIAGLDRETYDRLAPSHW